jgi:hypothetical protein
MTMPVTARAAGVAAGGGAGSRSKQKVEREGLDQDIELFGLEIIVAADPIKHEKRPSNRTVEVDRSRMSLSGDGGDEQEAGGKLPEAADHRAVG